MKFIYIFARVTYLSKKKLIMFEKEIDINGYHIFSSKGYRYMIRPNGKKENVGKYYYLNILFNYASCSPEYVNPFMDFIRDI